MQARSPHALHNVTVCQAHVCVLKRVCAVASSMQAVLDDLAAAQERRTINSVTHPPKLGTIPAKPYTPAYTGLILQLSREDFKVFFRDEAELHGLSSLHTSGMKPKNKCVRLTPQQSDAIAYVQ